MKSFTFVKCTYGGLSLRDLETVELKDLEEVEALLGEVVAHHFGEGWEEEGWTATPHGIVWTFVREGLDEYDDLHVKIREN